MTRLRISVRLDAETRRRLREKVEATGKNESALVREALSAYLVASQPVSALELARQLGLVGCAKGLPPDLSTNADHLEGFGR